MIVVYIHIKLSATLYIYYGGITSLPMILLPIISKTIRYDGIDYGRNYDGGISDFPGFVISQSFIS